MRDVVSLRRGNDARGRDARRPTRHCKPISRAPNGTRRWSSDTVLMSERIDRGFAAAEVRPVNEPADDHDGGDRDLVLVGFSQGAERIEWFAARYPERVRGVISDERSRRSFPREARARSRCSFHRWRTRMARQHEARRRRSSAPRGFRRRSSSSPRSATATVSDPTRSA